MIHKNTGNGIRDGQKENRGHACQTPFKLHLPCMKLQKHTKNTIQGGYKDWLCFWNQFIVEVDGSSIAGISKFNYLLKLAEGKPREDILGFPHTKYGYEEAKKILGKSMVRTSRSIKP